VNLSNWSARLKWFLNSKIKKPANLEAAYLKQVDALKAARFNYLDSSFNDRYKQCIDNYTAQYNKLTEALNSKQLGAINEELEKFKLLDKEIGQYWNQVNKSLLESVLKEEEIQKARRSYRPKSPFSVPWLNSQG